MSTTTAKKAAAKKNPPKTVADPFMGAMEQEADTIIQEAQTSQTKPHTGYNLTNLTMPIEQYETTSPHDILQQKAVVSDINSFIEEEKKPLKLMVIVRKIQRFGFRLGMERTEEKYQLAPGTGQTFQPWKRGDRFLTGQIATDTALRQRLESILGVDLNDKSLYYENVTYRMEDRPNGQILAIEDDYSGAYMEVIYHCMIASPLVANGMQEYSSGKKPEAEWYIENREAEAEAKQKVMSDEMEAFSLFNQMSPTRRIALAKILGMGVWGLSEAVIKGLLWDYLKKGEKGVSVVGRFITEATRNDRTIVTKALIMDAIHYNVFRLNNARDYVYGDEAMGATLQAVEEKLLSPKNASLRVAVEEKVNLKAV